MAEGAEVVPDTETKKRRRLAGAGGGAVGLALGIPVGMVTAHAADGSSPLPLRTFDWILEHGVGGLLLVLVFILGWMLIRQLKRNEALEHEYREKVEKLVREQLPIAERTRRALAQNTEVLRSLHLVADDEDAEDGEEGGET